MRATLSLLKEKGFKRNIKDISIRFFLILGGFFTIYQIGETFFNVHLDVLSFLIAVLIICVITVIIIYLETKALLTRTFHLEDDYTITIDVDDFLENAKQYPHANMVVGSNNAFNVDYASEGTLHRELLDAFFEKGGEKEKPLPQHNSHFDEYSNDRLFNYDELKQSIHYKVNHYEQFHLTPITNKEEGERYFQLGSIISEKYKTKRAHFAKRAKNIPETREMLFFANSQYSGRTYKGQKKTLNSIHLIWEHLHQQNIHGDALLMPLLGTGLSYDASHMSATIAIIDHFFDISFPSSEQLLKHQQTVPHLIISIHPKHIVEGEIDLLAIHKHIEAKRNSLLYAYRKQTIYYKIIKDHENSNISM